MKGIMMGNGTETDPYIIEDVYDFCAITNGDSGQTYYKLVNNIDFNNHSEYKRGISANIINAQQSVIDGNGKSIRNIVALDKGIIYAKKIVNTVFENLCIINISAYNPVISSSFDNCNFGVLLKNSFICTVSYNCTFSRCTINLSGDVKSLNFAGKFVETHINFSNLKSTQMGILFTNAIRSYLTGKIIYSGSEAYVLGGSITMDSSYFAIEIQGVIKKDAISSNTIASSNGSFFDYELLGVDSSIDGKGLIALSTSDCKNADILNGIGFTCVKVE